VAHPQIAVFARLAEAGSKAIRKIEGQQTLLGRTMHSIAYDEIHDEIVVPQQFGQAILTFRGGTNGEEAPIRVIQGPLTQLRDPDRLGIDPVNNEIYVTNDDAVLVFPREGQGNIAPVRVLQGPQTMLKDGAGAVAVDAVHNLLVVAGGSTLKIFNRTDSGDVKPRAIIGGPKTLHQLDGTKNITVYPPTGMIVTANEGTGDRASTDAMVGVWSIYDNGDVPPRFTIGGPNGMLRQARGVILDPKNKSVIVSDKFLNAVLTYRFPEIF
jgi:DNA-binding beta-propeller fold protein YncE